MEWTELPKLSYHQNVFTVDNMDQLRTLSKSRTDTSTVFKLIDQNALRLKTLREQTTASLNLDQYRKDESRRHFESEKFNMLNDRGTRLEPSPSASFSSSDLALTDLKTLEQRQEEWFRNIKKDVHLEESVLILQDLIRTNESKIAKSKN